MRCQVHDEAERRRESADNDEDNVDLQILDEGQSSRRDVPEPQPRNFLPQDASEIMQNGGGSDGGAGAGGLRGGDGWDTDNAGKGDGAVRAGDVSGDWGNAEAWEWATDEASQMSGAVF